MPLNLTINDGEIVPYLKYNAKAGRFYIRNDSGEEVEVDKPKLAFDFANIKTGWIYFEQGSGPEKIWDPAPGVIAAKPVGPRKFKRGFEVMVYSSQLGVREFIATATNCISAILQMYAAYESARKTNAGKAPIFECVGVKAISGMYGTNYEPTFILNGWAKVPAFDEHAPLKPTTETMAKLDDEIPF